MTTPFMIKNLFAIKGAGQSLPTGRVTAGKTGKASPFENLLGNLVRPNNTTPKGKFSAALSSPGGHALIAKLKQSLSSSGMPLDQMTADGKALAAIEKVLVGAGFEAVKVRDLLSALQTNAGGKGVRVSTLFQAISGLNEPSCNKATPRYLEISALPHLETMLAEFGLTRDEIGTILDKAKIEGKGIDTAKLAAELTLMQPRFGTPRQAVAGRFNREQLDDMLQRIGLSPAAGARRSAVGLADLISSLEKFAQGKSAPNEKEGGAEDETVSVSELIPIPVSVLERLGIDVAQLGLDTKDSGKSVLVSPAQFQQLAKEDAGFGGTSANLGRFSEEGKSRFGGALSPQRFAAELENLAGRQPVDGLPRGVAGDWGRFVKHVQPAVSENSGGGAQRADKRLPGKTLAASLLAGKEVIAAVPSEANTRIAPSFPHSPVWQAGSFVAKGVAGKDKAGHKTAGGIMGKEGAGPKVDGGMTGKEGTGLKMAGAVVGEMDGGANKVDIFQLEENPRAILAEENRQSAEALMRVAKPSAGAHDSPQPLFGDGGTRRVETSAPILQTVPQRATPGTLPYYVLDQVSRQILRSRLSNDNEIQLQLKPPSLGRLKMNIENTAAGLRVSIIAENSAARDMLLSNSGELKTALMDQGLRLDKIDVETPHDFDQSMADARQGSDGSGARKRFAGDGRACLETDIPETETPLVVENDNGALNLVA